MLYRSCHILLKTSSLLSRPITTHSTRFAYLQQRNPLHQQLRMATTKHKLNTGAEIPALGFGTWQDADSQEDAVCEALKAGYRHIDTAHIYGTEPMVAKGIKKSGVPREEIFITTKLWNNAHHPDDVEKQLDKSLENLGTDYVDLYLMHWPGAFKPSDQLMPRDDNEKIIPSDIDYVETYKAMEKCQQKGKAKAIGVSNFSKAEVERLLKEASVVPAAHQFEIHPYLQQNSFTDFHQQNNIHVTHYSPFGNLNQIYDKGQEIERIIDHPELKKIADKYGKTGAHVALAWGISKGHSVIPKSKTPSRIRDNLGGDFKLSQEDIDAISKIDKKMRFNDPSGAFGYKFYQDLDGKQ